MRERKMNNLAKTSKGLLTKSDLQTIRKYKEFDAKYKLLIAEKRQQIAEYMRVHNLLSIEDEQNKVTITYKKPYSRKSVDSKRLKAEKPDIYEEYSKTTDIDESVEINIIYD